jgi:bla regulator protein BlaR1
MIGEITNHLWQSTVFAAAVALLTLGFRKNRAEVRYWLWLSASLKFLVPFSLLISLGTRLWDALPAGKIPAHIAAPAVSQTMVQLTQPFPESLAYAPATHHAANWLPIVLIAIWAIGFVAIAIMRLRGWLRIRAAVRTSTPINIQQTIPVRASATLIEPGVVGFLRPVLLLPERILETLTSPQLEAVLAHEQSHIRRRDNLTSALHMLVEALFWFHPVVWWIGAKLVEERERACDEAVLALGSEPQVYAEGILNVCKSYLESPLHCVSGVTGSDLKKRVRAIMAGNIASELNFTRKFALAITVIATFAAPILVGLMGTPVIRAQSDSSIAPQYKYDVATIKPNNTGRSRGFMPGFTPDGYRADYVRLRLLIIQAYGVQGFQISGGPAWLDTEAYDVETKMDGATAAALTKLSPDEVKLARQQMLRSFLEERFGLKVHRETKEGPIYSLVIAKGGSKLHDAKLGSGLVGPDGAVIQGYSQFTNAGTIAHALSAQRIAILLSQEVKRQVVDKTGLKGTYDFTLEWARGLALSAPSDGEESDAAPAPSADSIFAAVQDQLGLKLVPGKGPVDVIVIDHVERPSGN